MSIIFYFLYTPLVDASDATSIALSFPDVPDDYRYEQAIHYLKAEGIVHGYQDDGWFRPENKITRAEFVKIVAGSVLDYDRDIKNCANNHPDLNFPDVEQGHWAEDFICSARLQDPPLVSGYPDGTFKPGNRINFAEAAKIIALARTGLAVPAAESDPWYRRYTEALEPPHALPDAIQSFSQEMTRAQVSEIYYRLLAGRSDKLFLTYHDIALSGAGGGAVADAALPGDCRINTSFEVIQTPDFADPKTGNAVITVKNTGSRDLASSGECGLKAYDYRDEPLSASFSSIPPGKEGKLSIVISIAGTECSLQTIKLKAGRAPYPKQVSVALGTEQTCSKNYYYVVFEGWSWGDSNTFFGSIFSQPIYKKEYVQTSNFYAPISDDCLNSKYFTGLEEMTVKAIKHPVVYNYNGIKDEEDVKKMLKNYRTDRWYKIKYMKDGEAKTGFIPVSALVLKDENLFKITYEAKNDKKCYIFTLPPKKSIYLTSDEDKINKLIWHNTVGSNIGFDAYINYYLGRDGTNDTNNGYKFKFVSFVPEYMASGSLDNLTGNLNQASIERQSVTVEIVNKSTLGDDLDIANTARYNFWNEEKNQSALTGITKFQSFTDEQYDALEKFAEHMHEKYDIKLNFLHLSKLPDYEIYDKEKKSNIKVIEIFKNNYDDRFGFYLQVLKTKTQAYQAFVDYITDEFSGIISHKNHSYYGKGCPSPAFDVEKLDNIN